MIAMMMIGTKTISTTTTISSSKTGICAFNNARFGGSSNDTFSRGSLKKKGEQRRILLRPKAASVAYDASGLFLGVGSATAAAVYGLKQKYEQLVAVDDLPKKGAHSVVFGVDATSIVVGASDLRVYGC